MCAEIFKTAFATGPRVDMLTLGDQPQQCKSVAILLVVLALVVSVAVILTSQTVFLLLLVLVGILLPRQKWMFAEIFFLANAIVVLVADLLMRTPMKIVEISCLGPV